jgi:C4-dicarboxylate-specific signal transduction histidine kinase
LLQVFLNITKNSLGALRTSGRKQLTIAAVFWEGSVNVYFEDPGPGVSQPERLFRPFQSDADMYGLGLYISRAILQTFHGDLRYEPRAQGACFIATLTGKAAAANE